MQNQLFLKFINKYWLLIICLICSIACAGSNGAKLKIVSSDSPPWADRIEISTKKKNWDTKKQFLTITPSMQNDTLYVPYDLSDAWRELDILLPEKYLTDVLKKFSDKCHISDEKLAFTDTVLILFLSEHWFAAEDSRLTRFFNLFVDLEPNTKNYDRNIDLLAGITVCKYYESKQINQLPDFVEFIKTYEKAQK